MARRPRAPSAPPRARPSRTPWNGSRTRLRPLIRRHHDETIGLVVGEPIAQLIACYLRRDPRVQLEDHVPTGGFERIEVVARAPAATAH